jgi:hypothetical protein
MTLCPLPVFIPAKRAPDRQPVGSAVRPNFARTSMLSAAGRAFRIRTKKAIAHRLRLAVVANRVGITAKISGPQKLSAKLLRLRKTL